MNIEVKKNIRADIEEETKTWGDTSQQLVSYWRGKFPDREGAANVTGGKGDSWIGPFPLPFG